MKRIGIKVAVILSVFIVTLIISNYIFNQGTTDLTVEMQEATLPVVSVLYDGRTVNTMRGFTNRIDNGSLRDSLSPIGDDRSLSFIIDKYASSITRIRYEVRSVDGSRLIENTDIENFEDQKGKITGKISIRDLIEDKQEYNLCFILSLDDGREAYYYTRIFKDEIDVTSKLDFVSEFNYKTFEPDMIGDITSYMETNSDGDNSTFAKVNIHSNKSQLGWGSMVPRKFGTTVTTIHEIDATTASISLDYMVSVRNGTSFDMFRVEEYYKIRESKDRFYLLAFDRSMTQIFEVSKESFVNNKIMLGIEDKESLILEESSDGNIVVFENDGRLFSYDISANKFATLTSFYDAGDSDLRNIYRKSKVKILNIEENGNITYMIYGYMNRGVHEGVVGIDVEYYNSLLNTIDEMAFIAYDKSPEVLLNDVSKLSYMNNFGSLYLYIDGNIVEYDLNEMKASMVSDDIREDTLFISKSNKTAVWQEGDWEDAGADLIVLDVKDGYKSTIEKKNSECIKALGFMNEDLIYGVSRMDDVRTNQLGDLTLLMDRIVIRSELGETLKEYDFADIYVVEGQVEDNQIDLKRVKKDEYGDLIDIHDDQITNNEILDTGKNKIAYAVTEKYETIAQIELKKNVDVKALKFLTPKEVIYEGGNAIDTPKSGNDEERYFLYYNGHIVDIKDDPGINIGKASELRGTIVDSMGHEIYKRAGTVVRNQIMSIKEESFTDNVSNMADCLNTILKTRGISRNTDYMVNRGDTPIEILENNLGNAHILNLTGSTVSAVTYYLDKDIPVLAIANGKPILLIGYNEQNLVWYDPNTRSIYKRGIKDSQAIFEESGNRFLTYSLINEE